jgi:plasmid replication initiation protein
MVASLEHEVLPVTISENNLVKKSNQLIETVQDLTLDERRIIYIFIADIGPKDNEFKFKKMSVKRIANILGIKSKNYYEQVKKTVLGLQTKVVRITEGKKEKYINWADYSEYDDGEVILRFTDKLKPYLLNLKDHYYKFQLKHILRLSSPYDMVIYELLKEHEFQRAFSMTIKDLREILMLPKTKYKRVSHFKLRILNDAQKHINELTDITFSYEDVKESRRIIGFIFHVQEKPKKIKTLVNQDLINELEKCGVDRFQAAALVKKYDSYVIQANLQFSLKKQTKIKNLAAFIVAAIKNNYALVPTEKDQDADEPVPSTKPDDHSLTEEEKKRQRFQKLALDYCERKNVRNIDNREVYPDWWLQGRLRDYFEDHQMPEFDYYYIQKEFPAIEKKAKKIYFGNRR